MSKGIFVVLYSYSIIPLTHPFECVHGFLSVVDRINLPYKFSGGTYNPTLVYELGTNAEAL